MDFPHVVFPIRSRARHALRAERRGPTSGADCQRRVGPPIMDRGLSGIGWWILALGMACGGAQAEDMAAVEARLSASVSYLASDELEGRGVGAAGIDRAAQYIAEQFAALGLKTDLYQDTPFQTFSMRTGAELGDGNVAALIGPPSNDLAQPERQELKLKDDYTPLSLGGSGRIDLPLVFAGYGITAIDEDYDDYASVDVRNKAVIVLRHEPQQDNPHSPFEGKQTSPYATFVRKASNAYEHGAAAVIFVTDDHEIQDKVARRYKRWQAALDQVSEVREKFKSVEKPSAERIRLHEEELAKLLDKVRDEAKKLAAEYDPVLDFQTAGEVGEGRDFPVLHCRRGAIDAAVKSALGADLAELERRIDQGPRPHSGELGGWRIQAEVAVLRQEAAVKNVAAVLEGDGPLADETIVVGAHYDHLGRGGSGSLAPGSTEIHNGADDNGSGTAALIEVARQLALRPQKLSRRVLFLAFTGEETGLIGSARYVRDPLFPLDQTVAMLNMDMVGRLNENKLILQGCNTAAEFDGIVDRLNERLAFQITRKPGGFGPSDHSSFYAKQVPVIHFFTGTHSDYHRPSDDVEKLNLEGMRRIAELVAGMAIEIAEAPQRPTYQRSTAGMPRGGGDSSRPYFGSVPDFSQDQPGYALMSVSEEGPAEKAGLKGGDIIVRLGESKIGGLEDFDSALRKFKAGDKVPVTILRDKQERVVEVILEEPR